MRIGNRRRLIVPILRSFEEFFGNWTRQTAGLIGNVYLHADYRVPVDAVSHGLQRILDSTDLWDGKVQGLRVTDATDQALELRAIVSARNSSNAWKLRCLVRERLVAFMNEHYPESLPSARAEPDTLDANGRLPAVTSGRTSLPDPER